MSTEKYCNVSWILYSLQAVMRGRTTNLEKQKSHVEEFRVLKAWYWYPTFNIGMVVLAFHPAFVALSYTNFSGKSI